MSLLIDAHNLSKTFGSLAAVDRVSLEVAGGEIYGLIGPDGAGKTTTIRLLTGALGLSPVKMDAGGAPSIHIAGYDMIKQPEQARAQIGYLAQRFSLYEDLTVLENIRFFAEQRGLPAAEWRPRCLEILEFVGLAAFTSRRAGQLSGGMKQKLGLAAALVHRPLVLLLDEPTTGVDPVTRQDFWQLIIRLAGETRNDGSKPTVFVSTPYMDEAARCNRIGFIQHGQLFLEGSPAELRQRMHSRVLELACTPPEGQALTGRFLAELRRQVLISPQIEDVQMFGDRLHLRVPGGQAEAVIARLSQELPSQGLSITRLRPIAPQLEDVFMELAAPVQSTAVSRQQSFASSQPLTAGGSNAVEARPASENSASTALGEPGESRTGNGQPRDIVIRTEDLTRQFGEFLAVDHVSFEVQAGEVVGYLGPNGSGKTTTIRMLLGLLWPSSGSAQVLGFDAARQSEQVRAQSGYMSQKFALYHELTVAENMEFYAGVYGMRDRSRRDDVIAMMGLAGLERTRVNELSTGWRQRLALGIAIVHRPRLLFLDEPTSGVDPTARRAFWDLIYELVEGGVTALVTTHYMDEAEYCGRVGIMRDGKLLAMDTPSELKASKLPGTAWDVFANELLPALNALEACPCVLRAGLVGDHLRAISPVDVNAETLHNALMEAGLTGMRIEPVEATLEDVFLALAGRD